jgi:hypothetical protein
MVPHIVFGPPGGDRDGDDDGYFPSTGIWRNPPGREAPLGPATSGICQPPVHASAVLLLSLAHPDDDTRRFVEALYEPLVAWHDYLHQHRAVDGDLVELWHPWESGMDNSPLWDRPLARLSPDHLEVTPYRRVDTDHVDAGQRPSDLDYDRYVHLVGLLRQHGYEPADPRLLPFRVRDVLFNSMLARAELDLAELAALIGADCRRRRERAGAIIEAMNRELWDEGAAMYVDADAVTGERIPVRVAGGLAPLIAPVPDTGRRDQLIATLRDVFVVGLSDRADGLLTVPEDEAGFDQTRYWRGPAWINIMWLLARGLADHGARELADRLERGIAHLVERAGFYEYFDPVRTCGLGSDDFSWTAALYLDVTAPR